MRLGFIGLGSMGRPMSLNLLNAGHDLTVYDIAREGEGARELQKAGAHWANTPREVAEEAEIFFTSLPGPPEVESVALGRDGLHAGAHKGSVYIDLSTNSPSLMRKIHRIFREQGVDVLDAPVSEGSDQAKYDGTLTIMVGGDEPVFERVKSVLSAIGRDHLVYVGKSGSGSICKIVNNLVVFAIHESLSEAIALGVRAGVPAEILAAVISESSGKSRVGDDLRNSLSRPQPIDSPAGGPLWLARKDVRLATDLGRELNIPMRIADTVDHRLTEWMARGWGRRWISVNMMVQEFLQRVTPDGGSEGEGRV